MILRAFTPTSAEALRLLSAFGLIVGLAVLLGAFAGAVAWLFGAEDHDELEVSEAQAERRRFQAVMSARDLR